MSFLADAIAHSMLAGVIGGYLLMKMVFGQEAKLGALLIGALLAGIVTVALIGFVTKVSRLKEDTAIGIMYTGIFALGALVVSIPYFAHEIHIDIYHYILGSVVAVSDDDLWLLAGVTAIVLSVVLLFYRQLQLTSFDPIMAASIGIPVLAIDYLLTACASLVVVAGVQIAGVILVIGLIITPAAAAYLLTDRLDRMIYCSAILGVIGFWLGFFLAAMIGADPGPTVIVTMTGIFVLVLILAPRYGLLADWIREANAVPQEIMEDVLGAMLREPGKAIPIAQIQKRVTDPNIKVRQAINKLAKQDYLEVTDGAALLTENGRREARRLVRAHRLWETYLEKTGTPEKEIHEKAHVLEHISDKATVEYLDDKLGHPLTDPHGSEIPEVDHPDTEEVIVSQLREGRVAEVVEIKNAAVGVGVSIGARITAGKRSDDGTIWTIIYDGREIKLDHDQADAIVVVGVESR